MPIAKIGNSFFKNGWICNKLDCFFIFDATYKREILQENLLKNEINLKDELSFLPAVFLINVTKTYIPTLALYMIIAAKMLYASYWKSHIILCLEEWQHKMFQMSFFKKFEE